MCLFVGLMGFYGVLDGFNRFSIGLDSYIKAPKNVRDKEMLEGILTNVKKEPKIKGRSKAKNTTLGNPQLGSN